MPWVRLDDQFFAHRKVADLSKDAKLLHLAALTHCSAQLTDGLVTPGGLRIICGLVDVRADVVDGVVAELVGAGLWNAVDGNAYRVHDYLIYNPSAERVRADRAASAQRQADFRERHPQQQRHAVTNGSSNVPSNGVTNDVGNAVRNGVTNGSPHPHPHPHPHPVPDPAAAAAAPSPAHAREDAALTPGAGATTTMPTAPDHPAAATGSSSSGDEMPAAIRTACAKIARMARPAPLDADALAQQLGLHRARDPAWLVA